MSSLKKVEEEIVGEESSGDSSHMEGRQNQSQMSQTQTMEKKKRRFAYKLFGYVYHRKLVPEDWLKYS
jgi:hypothetical protein